MKKIVVLSLVFSFFISLMSAGDVATFVDKGFSADGKSYLFGQYGRTDKKFQSWAEIIQVDIEKNDYVDSGVFRINPSAVTVEKTGKEVFESLEAKNYFYLDNLKCNIADSDHTLYVCEDVNKTGNDVIEFTDFRGSNIDNPNKYSIQLVQTIKESKNSKKSSFYIDVVKKDSNGNILTREKVGSPDILRKGIKNYKIERIFMDKSETQFIFVIEKTLEDDTGISIRYMVEAAKIK
jgi:predicted secreted protein